MSRHSASTTGRANYGIDAPGVVRNFFLAGVAGLLIRLIGRMMAGSETPAGKILARLGAVGATIGFAQTGLMIWSSTVGKLRMREKLLDGFDWHGDEQVLDVGCGRGALLTAAAQRLTTGKATGVDIWQARDQSGNVAEATLANARAEGVADRIVIEDADMRRLPFGDRTFDVVVSSMAIHNVEDAQGRARALREIARVLKPGGRVALLDFRHTAEYAEALRELGWNAVAESGLTWWLYPPVRIVRGTKPAA